jgi:phosphoribosyl-ATP pyrophosphohydrolase/phosphoribosyl-AMP cyclohydrolase
MRDRNAPLSEAAADGLAWDKMDGLLPAIVQDRASGRVLMLGYMDRPALRATFQSGLATFYSRSRQRLWQKGETSDNRLRVEDIFTDCDGDALLLIAEASGPTCHLGSVSCFGENGVKGPGWFGDLSKIIRERAEAGDPSSYTRRLLEEGIERIAQKIGEEGVEVALAAVTGGPDRCADEVADLIYHVSVLMEARGIDWDDVIHVLRSRHQPSARTS